MSSPRLIESDAFPFEFISVLAEKESWRKEVHRPLAYLHKWWAKRLGSVFRSILLGCLLSEDEDLRVEFYRRQSRARVIVLDPFMGSGTTIYEAHKLGCTALGRDINPLAVETVRVALGPMDQDRLQAAFTELSASVGAKLRTLYRSTDSEGRPCDVLYYFWVMQATCPVCNGLTDLLSSWVIAADAYPRRRPKVQLLCPSCGAIFPGLHQQSPATCPSCGQEFAPGTGPVRGAGVTCGHCGRTHVIRDCVPRTTRPSFRLYGKLVLNQDGEKEYLATDPADEAAYEHCGKQLAGELESGAVRLPTLALAQGHNTRQAMNYGFNSWRDFFNDRQLLALGWLQSAIAELPDPATRDVLLTLFSGILEFNNLFASYKGEGTGAVRHMFSHHILKPERTPIEANVWGTPKSSGSFSGLFRSRLLRAIEYRQAPTEVQSYPGARGAVCSPPFSGKVEPSWPVDGAFSPRGIYLSCGDSAGTGLPDASVDAVVTDPPFFDNVHYSELADFFYAWRRLTLTEQTGLGLTTRSEAEVQDVDPQNFSRKLRGVLTECHRVLTNDGLLVFTYHHSRDEGWTTVADAILGAGFVVVNAHPVRSEMSVATPKAQAKEPIQLDIVVVCRKASGPWEDKPASPLRALELAKAKARRLSESGFGLSRNDYKAIAFGQLLTTVRSVGDMAGAMRALEGELSSFDRLHWQPGHRVEAQPRLF